ncbi:MAG: hypothetical protein A2X25_09030 [Chloroflexi bacterium GWB2_49_20]|nr:MAG: hypothetical protein A2X25_09030 [Chloroflexi bacterium GWB2_49_20]OGN79424.1 MAG: hypothetical protein A2X26_04995 [Chloroflexi bacterium GWC2_49_37]OGN82807.1 MAG: hypothetical protein A2X27_07700 [Chloroflexi bacterium GWD2_49_16]
MDEEFILTGLAGKDDDNGIAAVLLDRIEQVGDGVELIGTQMNPGGALDVVGGGGEERVDGQGHGSLLRLLQLCDSSLLYYSTNVLILQEAIF